MGISSTQVFVERGLGRQRADRLPNIFKLSQLTRENLRASAVHEARSEQGFEDCQCVGPARAIRFFFSLLPSVFSELHLPPSHPRSSREARMKCMSACAGSSASQPPRPGTLCKANPPGAPPPAQRSSTHRPTTAHQFSYKQNWIICIPTLTL